MAEFPKGSEPNNIGQKEEIFGFILPVGIMPGFIVTPEMIQKAEEAERRYQENKDKKRKPPKPPSRPNIPIGRLALGST